MHAGLFVAGGFVAHHRAPQARLGAQVLADHDVLQRRQRGEQADVLERSRQAFIGNLVGFEPGQLHALKVAAARFGDVQRGHDVEQRGFARAVGADQAEDFAFADLKAHVFQSLQAAKALAQALGDQQRLAGLEEDAGALMRAAPYHG